MTSRHTGPVDAPVRPGQTRSQFLLARKQAAAHASTAHYGRIRQMGMWPAPGATPEPPSHQSDRCTD